MEKNTRTNLLPSPVDFGFNFSVLDKKTFQTAESYSCMATCRFYDGVKADILIWSIVDDNKKKKLTGTEYHIVKEEAMRNYDTSRSFRDSVVGTLKYELMRRGIY